MIKNVYEFLQHSALKYPDKIAYVDCFYDGKNHKSYTYKELDLMAKSFASEIARKLKTTQNAIMLLQGEKIEQITADFAVALSGNCSVKINEEFSIASIEERAKLYNIKAVILNPNYLENHKDLEEFFIKNDIKIIFDDKKYEIDEKILNERLECQIDTDLFSIITTSGSTGKPKGVCLSHKSVIDLLLWYKSNKNHEQNDKSFTFSSFISNATYGTIYASISAGASVYYVPKIFRVFTNKIKDLIEVENINKISAVPTLLAFYAKTWKKNIFTNISKIQYGGAVLPQDLFSKLKEIFPNARFINGYGATENVVVTNDNSKQNNTIQKARKNVRYYLFDDDMKLVNPQEINKKGVLYVAGSSLSAGYFDDLERTQAAFIQNPLHDNYQDLIYCTGDIMAYNEEGDLVCFGRADNQVKISEYKIDLELIEHAAMKHKNINQAICIFENENHYMFYHANAKIDDQEIRDCILMGDGISEFMLPRKFIQISSIKVLSNGKIDRNYYKTNYKELL